MLHVVFLCFGINELNNAKCHHPELHIHLRNKSIAMWTLVVFSSVLSSTGFCHRYGRVLWSGWLHILNKRVERLTCGESTQYCMESMVHSHMSVMIENAPRSTMAPEQRFEAIDYINDLLKLNKNTNCNWRLSWTWIYNKSWHYGNKTTAEWMASSAEVVK